MNNHLEHDLSGSTIFCSIGHLYIRSFIVSESFLNICCSDPKIDAVSCSDLDKSVQAFNGLMNPFVCLDSEIAYS